MTSRTPACYLLLLVFAVPVLSLDLDRQLTNDKHHQLAKEGWTNLRDMRDVQQVRKEWEAKGHPHTAPANVKTIFLLCVFMYGGIGLLWVMYFKATNPNGLMGLLPGKKGEVTVEQKVAEALAKGEQTPRNDIPAEDEQEPMSPSKKKAAEQQDEEAPAAAPAPAADTAKEVPKVPDNIKVGLLCLSWGSTSVGMHTLNKSLVTTLDAPALITLVQMVIAVVVVVGTSGRAMYEANGKQLKTWLIVPVFFSAMLLTSFYTYSFISLSMLTVVRNLTPLVVLPIESFMMPADKRPKVNSGIVSAIIVMIVGAGLYAGSIKTFSVIGIIFAFVNMVLAITDRLIQRRLLTTECQGLPSSVCTIMNNALGAIPTIGLAFITHQVQELGKPENAVNWMDKRIIFMLLLSGFVGIGICYLGFECQRVVSATSFFVLQNVTKVAVVGVGIIIFGDPIHSAWSVIGLFLSLGGSFVYGTIQMRGNEEEKKATDKQKA